MTSEFFNVGIVGFSKSNFDHNEAERMIKEAFDQIESNYPDKQKNCVSGLTNQGVPALAYAEAVKRGWKTTGVACGKVRVKKYDLFPVDFEFIEGEQWGDESQKFLSLLNIIIRVGGGKQSQDEIQSAKDSGLPVIEFNLLETQS
jgi:hypothetical protein